MHHEQDMRRMGGLKKYMPKTYWTFFAGWLAICGIIPFSGFWSKDEILWNAASTTYIPYGWIIWLVGTIAATCTAFYMTRLMAMTFWGKEKFLEVSAGDEADEAHAHGVDEFGKPHDAQTFSAGDRPHHEPGEHVGLAHEVHASHTGAHKHDAHEHGSFVPHESPPSMWVPLAVLAVLAVIGGFVGISPVLTGGHHVGGRMNIVNWLSPVIWNPQTKEFNRPEGVGAGEAQEAKEGGAPSAYGDTGFNLAHTVEHSLGEKGTEFLFIGISLLAAGLGMFLGWLFYVKDTRLPDIWARRLAPLYRASFNRYWVDELYGAVFTRRTMDAARGVYEVDSDIVDGAVNGVATLTRGASRVTGAADKYVVDGLVNSIAGFIKSLMSPLIRAAQTGLTANYALVMVLGLVVAVAIFFAKDIWKAVF
jgi:NADH-quinone oxidoreductase subunit L